MSEINEQEAQLDALKAVADNLGIAYHPSIGIAKLEGKISQIQSLNENAKEPEKELTAAEQKSRQHTKLRNKCRKLVRIRLNCMNPNKQAWPGEIFTIGNKVIGTFKKFVPYNAEAGYHVPNIIYEHLKERQCQIFRRFKLPNGQEKVESKMIKEFNIEVLPALTQKELDKLATEQAISQRIE